MILKKIIINGFRSIKAQVDLLVEEKVTVLIGANDHGKSNILQALTFLNDEKTFVEDDKNWDLPSATPIGIQWIFNSTVEISEKLAKMQMNSDEKIEGENPVEEMINVNTDNQIIFFRNNIENTISVQSVPIENIPKSKIPEILSFRPRVELFEPPVSNIIDQVNLSTLENKELEFMQGIFRLAGIWENRSEIFTQTDRTSKILDQASKKLTEILNTKWNQGRDLKWKLEHTGTNGDNIVIKIEDPAISNQYTRPSLRSSGFKTYFLLSMIIYARTEGSTSNNYIYLFDEPGTYLHPLAQLDLQRSFEAIADKTQILYTTHSLFLINKNYPDRNRVVSKSMEGTKIDQKPFIKNWKSVRNSLGILLSNNFLIAEKTLLVEGPSDVIYLLHAIKRLKVLKKIDIDLNDFSVVDAGTSQNYIAMAKLMISEGREVVALFDGDKQGNDIEKNLKKVCEGEIQNKKLQLHKLPDHKSIEDIFVDLATYRNSVKEVANDLIRDQIRELRDSINLESEISKINYSNEETLGYVVDKLTKTLFKSDESLSKLSVALKYEDILPVDTNPPASAEEEIKKIKNKLMLRSERNDNKGVFEEL